MPHTSTYMSLLYRECKQEPYLESAISEEVQEKLWAENLKWLDIKEYGKVM